MIDLTTIVNEMTVSLKKCENDGIDDQFKMDVLGFGLSPPHSSSYYRLAS